MDRIDKILLILPLLPLADLLSTLFSLGLGGEEVGILARPVLEHYGTYGLVMLAVSTSIVLLFCMQVVIHIKKLFIKELRFRWMWYVLAIPTYWFFMVEAVYVSTVIMNFLVPLSPAITQATVFRTALVCMYFVCVSVITLRQVKQLPHF